MLCRLNLWSVQMYVVNVTTRKTVDLISFWIHFNYILNQNSNGDQLLYKIAFILLLLRLALLQVLDKIAFPVTTSVNSSSHIVGTWTKSRFVIEHNPILFVCPPDTFFTVEEICSLVCLCLTLIIILDIRRTTMEIYDYLEH